MATRDQVGKDLVADRTCASGDVVDRDSLAYDGRDVTAVHNAVQQIGNVNADQIHRDAADNGTLFAGDVSNAAPPFFAATHGARQSVGIAEGRDGDARCAGCRPTGAIADGLAAVDVADLQDTTAQFDDTLHRVGTTRRRIDAVKRSARPCQVEMRGIVEEYSGRIGERGCNAAE